MGWGDIVGTASGPMGWGYTGISHLINKGGGGGGDVLSNRGGYTPEKSGQIGIPLGESAGITRRLFGTNSDPYSGVFKTAYGNLGQPNEGVTTGTGDIAMTGVNQLSDSFINSYKNKLGKLPSDQEIKDFVGKNLTPRYAEDIIKGNATPDTISATLSNPAIADIQSQAPSQAQADIQNRQLGLSDMVNGLYDKYMASLPGQVDQAFIPQRQRLAANQAATGNYRSGVGLGQDSALGAQEGQTLAGMIGNANQERIGSQIGTATNVENLLAQQRSLEQQGKQFGTTSGLAQQQFAEQQRQADIQRQYNQQMLTLSSMLGKQQADANSSGLGGDIFGGALGGAAAGSAFGPWGAGIGALLGGAGSGLTTRKRF